MEPSTRRRVGSTNSQHCAQVVLTWLRQRSNKPRGSQTIRAGMPASAVMHVATKEAAADAAMERLRPGDLVLVKGSRGIGTDLVVERLTAEFA